MYYFPVRKNLFFALQQLRSAQKTLVLWIDAICVDQNRVEERNHQVRLMRLIYSTTNRVQVWLGPEDERNTRPFDPLRRIIESMRYLEEEDKYYHDREMSRMLAAWFAADEWQDNREEWINLRALLTRSYWNRIWIVQEFVLARNLVLHCGSESIYWDDFSA
jgi:hypothetical protein